MSARAVAQSSGRQRYTTGLPCKSGHLAERYTRNGHCVECQAVRNRVAGPIWRQKNPERVKELNRRFYERDPDYSIRNRRKRWDSFYSKRCADPQRRLANNLRAAICGQLRRGGTKKATATTTLLGCSIEAFKRHIEKQWLPGMDWGNWGQGKGCWHLDHKRPIASFDLTDPAQQRECFNFANYQPLWAEDNIRKGARWQPCAEAA